MAVGGPGGPASGLVATERFVTLPCVLTAISFAMDWAFSVVNCRSLSGTTIVADVAERISMRASLSARAIASWSPLNAICRFGPTTLVTEQRQDSIAR